MAKTDVKEVKKYLRQCMEERGIEVKDIALFGSHLDGHPNPDSDIDFIVLSDSFKNKTIFERAEMVTGVHYKVIQKFDVPLDILLKTPEEFKEMLEAKMIYAEVI
jgi:uncharacterized protein